MGLKPNTCVTFCKLVNLKGFTFLINRKCIDRIAKYVFSNSKLKDNVLSASKIRFLCI